MDDIVRKKDLLQSEISKLLTDMNNMKLNAASQGIAKTLSSVHDNAPPLPHHDGLMINAAD